MKILNHALIFVFILFTQTSYAGEPLDKIKNFRQLTPNLASAGMPTDDEFKLLKQQGFKHIINLIPGDFSREKKDIENLGMTFDQIEVVWEEPKVDDFKQLVNLMDKYKNEKVLIHCRLNYRASAFSYLYLVTHQNADNTESLKQMLSVWHPRGTWENFNHDVLKHYKVTQ